MAKKKSKKIGNKSSKKSFSYYDKIICIVITIGIVLRILPVFLFPELSNSEILLKSDILTREYWGLFNALSSIQAAPPLFLSAVKLSVIYPMQNLIDFMIRLVPFISSILSIFAFLYLLKNIFPSKYVQVTGLVLFVLNPWLIYNAYRLNPFSTDIFISILLIIYFTKYNPESYNKQFFQILCLSGLIFLSYPAGFVLAGGIVNILFKDYKKFFTALTAFILVLIFYFVYHLWGVMEINGEALDTYWAAYFINTKNLVTLTTLLIKNSFNIFILPIISISILAAGLLVSYFRDTKTGIIITVLFAVLLVSSYLHIYPLSPMTAIFLIPVFIILVCELCDLIKDMPVIENIIILSMILLSGYYLFTALKTLIA